MTTEILTTLSPAAPPVVLAAPGRPYQRWEGLTMEERRARYGWTPEGRAPDHEYGSTG